MRLHLRTAARRATLLGASAAALTVAVALPAMAADDDSHDEEMVEEDHAEESDDHGDANEDEDSGLGAPLAAGAGVFLGLLGFGMSEAGKGGYPVEHH